MWNYRCRGQIEKGGNAPILLNKREEQSRNKSQSSLKSYLSHMPVLCFTSPPPASSASVPPLPPVISQLTHTTPAEPARSSCPPGREMHGRRRRWWGHCRRCGSPPGWARCSRCMWDCLERAPPHPDALRWRGTRRGGDSQEEGVCILTQHR